VPVDWANNGRDMTNRISILIVNSLCKVRTVYRTWSPVVV
jgi:hypothetical protein